MNSWRFYLSLIMSNRICLQAKRQGAETFFFQLCSYFGMSLGAS
jgi:hypothetical protein